MEEDIALEDIAKMIEKIPAWLQRKSFRTQEYEGFGGGTSYMVTCIKIDPLFKFLGESKYTFKIEKKGMSFHYSKLLTSKTGKSDEFSLLYEKARNKYFIEQAKREDKVKKEKQDDIKDFKKRLGN